MFEDTDVDLEISTEFSKIFNYKKLYPGYYETKSLVFYLVEFFKNDIKGLEMCLGKIILKKTIMVFSSKLDLAKTIFFLFGSGTMYSKTFSNYLKIIIKNLTEICASNKIYDPLNEYVKNLKNTIVNNPITLNETKNIGNEKFLLLLKENYKIQESLCGCYVELCKTSGGRFSLLCEAAKT